MTRIWIDVDDLWRHARSGQRMTGIFRVAYELSVALAVHDVGFLRHAAKPEGFVEVDFPALVATVQAEHPRRPNPLVIRPAGPPGRVRCLAHLLFRRLPPETSVTLGRAVRAAKTSMTQLAALPRAIRWDVSTALRTARYPARDLTRQLGPGTRVFAPGAAWEDPNFAARVRALRANGAGFGLLVHDVIPLARPEWCDPAHTENFAAWFTATVPQADRLLAISHATARDVAQFGRVGMPRVVPMGTGFSLPPPAPRAPRLPVAGSYVLFVSTIEPRKNHALALRIWRTLLEQRPGSEVPRLIFAGRQGAGVADLMSQLVNSAWLGGHVQHIPDASDTELVQLYEGCRFTLFPSLFEGWGLPVTESLAFGRPCLAARTTSLPEAGGDFARYFDPDNLHDAVATVAAAIDDPAGMEAQAARIRADFQPTTWHDMARAVLAALTDGERR